MFMFKSVVWKIMFLGLFVPWVLTQPNLQDAAKLAKSGDLKGALEQLDRIIAAGPNPEALMQRGHLHLNSGKSEAALADFKAVLGIDPTRLQAIFGLAQAHHQKGLWQEAEKAATDYLKSEKRNARAFALRGNSRLQQKVYDKALRDLQAAVHLQNDLPMAYFDMGRVYQAQGDEERTRRMTQRACALSEALCGQPEMKGANQTRLIVNLAADKEPRTCGCCATYNSSGIHREDLVQLDLKRRKDRQLRTVGKFKVFHDFQFENRLLESGVGFVHEAVDDGTKDHKPVHYDHGNGLAVADVDGDHLLDVYYLNQMGGNQLWRNLGGGRFEDITQKAGVALEDRISVAGSFADIDNDGDADLYVTTVRMGNVLFENDGKGRFRDITASAGLSYSGHSSGAVFFDYDRDGLLDLFLTNVGTYTHDETGWGGYFIGMTDAFAGHLKPERQEVSILYRNLGGRRFEDVSKSTGLVDPGFSGDASFTDFDGDGDPDLYVLNMQGDDRYYRNDGGRFSDQTAALFPKTPWGAMGLKFFDYNNDGKMDLYITDMHSDMSERIYPRKEKKKANMQWTDEFLQGGSDNLFGNGFYRAEGKGFREVSDEIGVENYWPWGLSAGDLNGDGFQDLFVASSMNYPFRYGINSVLLNQGGTTFMDSEFILGVEPRPVSAKPWFQLDCSGADVKADLCRGKTGWLQVWGAYGSRASALFDYDGDGDLDILTNEFHSEPLVLASNLSERKTLRYLKVRLKGTRSNRDGLGARVTVIAGDRKLVQYHDGKSGYLSQSLIPLYFGLGDAEGVDRVEVTWPSGTHQVHKTRISVPGVLALEEPNLP